VAFPLAVLSQYIFGSVLFLLSAFIIAIILLQRGKGGGLTGALGGLGGQSAFGVKAGDIFTRITAIAVLLWIFTCALACRWYRTEDLDIEADVSSSSMGTSDSGFGPGFEGIPSGTEPAPPASDVAPSNAAPADGSPSLPDAGSAIPQTPVPAEGTTEGSTEGSAEGSADKTPQN
jgi:preprotein translocase subunit SecG